MRSRAAANFQKPCPLTETFSLSGAGALIGPSFSVTNFSGVAAFVEPWRCLNSASCAFATKAVPRAKATKAFRFMCVVEFVLHRRNGNAGEISMRIFGLRLLSQFKVDSVVEGELCRKTKRCSAAHALRRDPDVE